MVVNYLQLRGNDCGVDTTVITEIADYFEKELNVQIPSNQPLIGRSFNTTRAGIHADGLLKNEEIYNVFNTEKLLNRPVELAVTDKSGQAGVALWIKKYFKKAKVQISKNDEGVQKIYEWMMTQYDAGRTTAIADEELLAQAKVHLATWLKENGYEV
jgi:isopropylmalate/homocitrate/citramalate synthase